MNQLYDNISVRMLDFGLNERYLIKIELFSLILVCKAPTHALDSEFNSWSDCDHF